MKYQNSEEKIFCIDALSESEFKEVVELLLKRLNLSIYKGTYDPGYREGTWIELREEQL